MLMTRAEETQLYETADDASVRMTTVLEYGCRMRMSHSCIRMRMTNAEEAQLY